ncbi:MAG: TetR/AcrR family transcriptional regulator [Granulosicoccus sp.]
MSNLPGFPQFDTTNQAPSRKQREIADRHNLFLSIARKLVHEKGFHQLSMDVVAEQAEYSKGTLYQHFSCKEEILIQICNHTILVLHSLGQRAATYPGTHRERLLAFAVAHELWLELEPADIYMMQNVHTDGVLDKASEQSLETHNKLQNGILQLVAGIIQEAINDGDLPAGRINAAELVYGLWSMTYGGQLLRSYQIPLKEMGVLDPGGTITTLIQATLDGLGWKPSMSVEATSTLLVELQTNFFKADIETLRLNR